jgi:hypothetical protein
MLPGSIPLVDHEAAVAVKLTYAAARLVPILN